MHHGQDDRKYRLRRTGGNGDFVARAVAVAVQPLQFVGHRLAQRQDAGHGRVLVVALLHGLVDRVQERRIAGKVGEALAQIDRLVLSGQG